jgi:hypothetical protein
VEPKTIRGRMLKPISCLGYSLVDCLDQDDVQKTAHRNVSHGGILELITRGVRYILK